MGNAQGNPIRNIDKRTARREYKDTFQRAILKYQLDNGIDPSVPRKDLEKRILNFGDGGSGSSSNVRVVVRKRPIFEHEIDGHEFDVATCLDARNVTIHDTRMHADMRRMLLTNNSFEFDGVFNEWASNDEVYASAARPLVKEAVLGGFATACVYGQTGSGKSFTMTSFYEKAAQDIFRDLDAQFGRFDVLPRVSMCFFELQGDTCLDLLNCFQVTQLLTAVDGGVHAVPCVEPTVSNADEMIELIRHALSIRTTAATGVHDASSRSHAILRVFIEQKEQDALPRGDEDTMVCDRKSAEGVLTLVDLAGSEQSIDSMYHSAERRKEGAAINSSLMALKECIRAKAAGKAPTHIFRKSKLTMALKHSFGLPTARTVVVATVSPSSKDTEHSLNTLRHACLMDGQEADSTGESRFITGGIKSKTVEVGQVNVTEIARKNRALKAEGKEVKDRTSNGNTFGSDTSSKKKGEKELTEKEKLKARRLADRRGLARMSSVGRELLELHRDTVGSESQQLDRMRRPPVLPPGKGEGSLVSLPPGQAEENYSSSSLEAPNMSKEPVYKITNTNECSSAETTPRSSYDFSPRASQSPRSSGTTLYKKQTSASIESRQQAQELLKARNLQKLKLKKELERIESEEAREFADRQREEEVATRRLRADIGSTKTEEEEDLGIEGRYEEDGGEYTPFSNQNGGLVEGSYNKKTMLANQEQQERMRQQNKVRKSHMSSYGGMSSADGARNAVVHDTLQTRETRPVDMRVAKTRSNAPARNFPNKDAKAKAMAEALQKVEQEAALKEMRRERARAVMRSKGEEGKEAARAANRAAAGNRYTEAATEAIDREAMVRSTRREQAQLIRDAKDEEKKQQALRRLQSKGLNPPATSSRSTDTLEVAPESHTESQSEEDVEIRRLERQLVSLRYQPEAKQYRVKKQLAVLKASKLRKERGEPSPRGGQVARSSSSTSANRPSSGRKSARPSSAGREEPPVRGYREEPENLAAPNANHGATMSTHGADTTKVCGSSQQQMQSPRPYPDQFRHLVETESAVNKSASPAQSSFAATGSPGKRSVHIQGRPTSSGGSMRLGAAAAPWGNSFNS